MTLAPGAAAIQMFACPTCDMVAGARCVTATGRPCPPHVQRWRLGEGWVARQSEIDQLAAALDTKDSLIRALDEDLAALMGQSAELADALKTARAGAALVPVLQDRITELGDKNAALKRDIAATQANVVNLATTLRSRDETITALKAHIDALEHPRLAFGVGIDVIDNLETTAGVPVAYHRTYWTLGGGVHAAAVAQAKADLAAGRTPVLSFKIPGNDWAGAVEGIYDARLRATCEALATLGAPVIVCVHHEPEGDGPLDVYRAMTARLVGVVKVGAVQFWQCGTGYHQLYGNSEWKLDAFYAPGVDGIGFDPYQSFGASSTSWTDQTARYYKPFGEFATKHGVQWGIWETGINEQAALTAPVEKAKNWFADCAAGAKTNGATMWVYFNSETTKDGKHDWRLSTTGANKQAQMVAVMKQYARKHQGSGGASRID